MSKKTWISLTDSEDEIDEEEEEEEKEEKETISKKRKKASLLIPPQETITTTTITTTTNTSTTTTHTQPVVAFSSMVFESKPLEPIKASSILLPPSSSLPSSPYSTSPSVLPIKPSFQETEELFSPDVSCCGSDDGDDNDEDKIINAIKELSMQLNRMEKSRDIDRKAKSFYFWRNLFGALVIVVASNII